MLSHSTHTNHPKICWEIYKSPLPFPNTHIRMNVLSWKSLDYYLVPLPGRQHPDRPEWPCDAGGSRRHVPDEVQLQHGSVWRGLPGAHTGVSLAHNLRWNSLLDGSGGHGGGCQVCVLTAAHVKAENAGLKYWDKVQHMHWTHKNNEVWCNAVREVRCGF